MNQQIFVVVYCTLLGESHAPWGPKILCFVAFRFVCKKLIVISQDIFNSWMARCVMNLFFFSCKENRLPSTYFRVLTQVSASNYFLHNHFEVVLACVTIQYSKFVISKSADEMPRTLRSSKVNIDESLYEFQWNIA